MKIPEERIEELFSQMMNDVDENGWSNMPEDISEDEEIALTERLTMNSMSIRIDTLLEGMLAIFDYLNQIQDSILEYDMLDRLKIKGSLENVIADVEDILIDLHSSDRVTTFFNIKLVKSEDGDDGDIEIAKAKMEQIITDNFTEQLDDIKGYCDKLMFGIKQLIKRLEND